MEKYMRYFNTRRTVRRYTDAQVPEELLSEMIAAAAQAPNTGNMQLYSVVVTRTAEGKARLAPAHFNQPSATSSGSVLLTFCADFNRFEHWCKVGDASTGYDNFQAFSWAVIDASIFAQQFCTIAEMNGLGCCYLGTTTYNAPEIARVLSLPSRVVPVTTIAVGYPVDDDTPMSDRLPLEAIMHKEVYRDFSDDDIRRIYALKESLDENRRFVAENGKQTLAQVYTDVRYTREANEHFSRLYLDFITSCGFKLPE